MEVRTDNLHHAYLLVGVREDTRAHFESALEQIGVPLRGNPDLFEHVLPTFGIGDARSLRELAQRSSFAGKKVFWVAPERLTLEAQNALLKTFEEPVEDTHFFLSVREEEDILPTLRSRMEIVHMSRQNLVEKTVPQDSADFLSSSLKERLEFAKEFADKEGDLPLFIDNLLKLERERGATHKDLKKIYALREYAGSASVPKRLIVEHLALVL